MRIVIIIPARYDSTRFPGKPLALICQKPMLNRVWEKCKGAVNEENIVIATDDSRIYDHCITNKMNVMMTNPHCLTGTDRVAEVSTKIDADAYINVQGDEPLIDPQDIIKVIDAYDGSMIVNAMTPIKDEEEYFNLNVPKVAFNQNYELLYMSRAAIPANKKNKFEKAWKQVCIYAFSKKALLDYSNLTRKTTFEAIEDIEILRFLELGYKVKMIEIQSVSIAVDVPEDLIKVENKIKKEKFNEIYTS